MMINFEEIKGVRLTHFGDPGLAATPSVPSGKGSLSSIFIKKIPQPEGANRGGFEKNLGDSTEGKRGPAVFGRNREGPPAKNP